jgi:hypothetical protein
MILIALKIADILPFQSWRFAGLGGGWLRTECPKCHSFNAWYEKTASEIILRCLCGQYKIVQSHAETSAEVILTSDLDGDGEDIALPRRKTKLWNCLAMLVGLGRAELHYITMRLNLIAGKPMSVSDVASQLTVLRYKGLARPSEIKKDGRSLKRGIPGGSIWLATDDALKLFDNGV